MHKHFSLVVYLNLMFYGFTDNFCASGAIFTTGYAFWPLFSCLLFLTNHYVFCNSLYRKPKHLGLKFLYIFYDVEMYYYSLIISHLQYDFWFVKVKVCKTGTKNNFITIKLLRVPSTKMIL